VSGLIKVKICGITNVDDGLHAAKAGADFLGYIFVAKSLRSMATADVRTIIQKVRNVYPNIAHVGVFVNMPLDELVSTVRTAGLDFVQLHGTESAEYCRLASISGLQVIKVFKFGNGAPPANWSDFREPNYFLCDTFAENAEGGTGRGFDRTLLPPGFPIERSFLAGGLTPSNISGILTEIKPFAVDVSSGVEASPGKKDYAKVTEFIARGKSENKTA
jgi:phosphoribosylanthranilate isomerase